MDRLGKALALGAVTAGAIVFHLATRHHAVELIRDLPSHSRHNQLFWSALLTALALLFVPGIALRCTRLGRKLDPGFATALLPLPGLAAMAATGIAVWIAGLGHHPHIAEATAGVVLAVSGTAAVMQLLRGGPLSLRCGWLAAYLIVCAAALGYSMLPQTVEQEFFGTTSMRGRMAASPPDSAIPYYTAAFLLHGKDPRHADPGPYFWGWAFTSRGPMIAFIDAAALDVEGLLPADPPTTVPFRLADRHGFFVVRIWGILCNALVLLAAGALLEALGATAAGARFGLAWTAICPGGFINVIFTWPKLFSTAFAMLAAAALKRSAPLAGALAACAYLAHPVGGFFLPAVVLLAATGWSGGGTRRERARRAVFALLAAAATLAPWLAYKWALHEQDPFGAYLLGDGRGFARAAGASTWLRARWSNLFLTLAPLVGFFGDNWRVWTDGPLSERARWALQATKTLPGQLGLGLFWLFYLRLATPRSLQLATVRNLMIVLPLVAMVAFWGFSSDGLGRNSLEPLTMLAVAYTAAQQESFGRRERLLLGVVTVETLFAVLAPLS